MHPQEQQAAGALRERAQHVQGFLAAVCTPNSAGTGPDSSLLRILSDALATQHPDGSFGSDDSPRQKPCYTAQTITLMYQLGIRYSRLNDGSRQILGQGHSVRMAVEWLEAAQNPDGSWGEDAWDTCQTLLALHLCGYEASDPCISRALTLLRDNVSGNWPNRTSFWFGPSFHGAAMQVFNAYGDTSFAARALTQIWDFWDDESGCFRSPNETDGQHAPAEWQTACAVAGLRSFGAVSPAPDRVDRAFAWLVKMQSPEGCWSAGLVEITGYCTLQAIVALMRSSYQRNREAAAKGTQWFIDLLGTDGRLTVKLMTSAAIARTHSEDLVAQVSFYWVEEIIDLLTEYESLSDALLNDLTAEQNRRNELVIAAKRHTDLTEELRAARDSEARSRSLLDSYAFKATANQLAVWGIALGVVTFVLGVLAQILLG